MAKVWANGLVILVATGAVAVPGRADGAEGAVRRLGRRCGSSGVVLYLFFATALGIFLGTISRSMAQFALLIILVIVVLQLLSGGSTPVESQPKWLQYAHVPPAVAALRQLLAGDHLSRRRPARGLAAVPDGRRDRPRLLRLQPVRVPQVDRGQQIGAPSRISRPLRCASPGGRQLGKSESTMNDAPATVAVPWFSAVAEYMLDAWQRTDPDLGRPARARQPVPRARAVGKAPGARLRLRAGPGRARRSRSPRTTRSCASSPRPINRRWIRPSGRSS